MIGYIYLLENLVNGKMYVGQTTRLNRRQKAHLGGWSKCPVISAAIQKHGQENFDFVLLEKCFSRSRLNEREIYWISCLATLVPKGYNLKTGGDCGGAPSLATRERISKSLTGYKHTDETKAKLSAERKKRFSDRRNHPNYGREFSPTHRRRIGLSHKGKRHWAYGQKMSRKSVECMRASKQGKKTGPRSVAARRNLSLGQQKRSILTRKVVEEIKTKYSLGGISQRSLASEYQISQAQIGNIVRRKCWRYE